MPKKALTSLYHSFISPFIDYNLLNWSCSPTTNLDPIRISLKKAIRIISFKTKQEHSAPLFQNFNIPNSENCIKLKQATFMWKLDHQLLPDYAKRHITYSESNYGTPKSQLTLNKQLLSKHAQKITAHMMKLN